MRWLVALVFLASCGAPQTRGDSVELHALAPPVQGHFGFELQRLHTEGWLSAFRQGRCAPLGADEELEEPPTPAERAARHAACEETREDLGDIIGGLVSCEEVAPRSPPCADAAVRYGALQRAYREAQGSELLEANRSIATIAARSSGEAIANLCPVDDRSLFGAQLAVARALAVFEGSSAPFLRAENSCTLPTFGGSVPVFRDPSELVYEDQGLADYPPAFAADEIVLTCSRDVPGHEDGCVRSSRCGPPNGQPCRTALRNDTAVEAGSMTIIVARTRAAMGCGSTGTRAYHLQTTNGYWRVVREEIIEHGLHGQ